MPTISVENYLKAIYHLQREAPDGRVKTKALAEYMALSLPSVTGMLKTLSDEGLAAYEPYRGARLTEPGERAALRVIRHHRLVEVFLVTTLGYSWDEVHAEAERLEHAVSDTLAERIDRFLAHPRFDPHGDPIPTADGLIDHCEGMPLSQAPVLTPLRIERVLDQQPEVLRYLTRIGLTPRATLEVLEILPFDGQMFLRVNGESAALSRALASRLLVSALDPASLGGAS